MAGSRSTAPLNRSNSVLIIVPLSAFEIYGYIAPLHEKRKGYVLSNAEVSINVGHSSERDVIRHMTTGRGRILIYVTAHRSKQA
jgi:hypothetical protein